MIEVHVLVIIGLCLGMIRNFFICLGQLNHGVIRQQRHGIVYNYPMFGEIVIWITSSVFVLGFAAFNSIDNDIAICACVAVLIMGAVNLMSFILNLKDHKLRRR